ncbi:MAG: helix-turn-helix domain-containing protein [Clostridia bacterium]|nr:helix-turn-helix domain-containing protein [Clostridia bacterium]
MNFGETLFKLRKEKNLSQEDVADKLNVTRQTVSKWETNQSTPDFDKILPLCELFEISTEELLTGRKPEENNTKVEEQEVEQEKAPTKEEVRKKSAEVVSTSVFIYIAAVAILIVAIPVLQMNPIVATALFLCMIAWATARIIKHYMSIPKFEKSKEEKKETEIIKQINGIVGAICTIIYFIVSFATMAWYITWVIFIIDGLICQIIKLLFMLKDKEGKTDEE